MPCRLCKAKAGAEKLGAQWITAEIADNMSAYVYKFSYALAWKAEQLKGVLLYLNAQKTRTFTRKENPAINPVPKFALQISLQNMSTFQPYILIDRLRIDW